MNVYFVKGMNLVKQLLAGTIDTPRRINLSFDVFHNGVKWMAISLLDMARNL